MTVEPQDGHESDEVTRLRAQLEELRKAKDHQRSFFDDTFDVVGIGIAHVDLEGRFLDVNATLCTMLGYAREELIGRRFAEFTYSDDLDPNLDHLARVLEGKAISYRMDKRYRRANGDLLWADLVVRAQLGPDGRPVKLISAVTDIAERKQFEDRQKFLLGELSHRTNNLVGVINTIAQQTAKSAESVEAMVSKLSSRLTSMAASQAALAHTDSLDTSDVAELCQLQLATFLPADDPRITMSGPSFRISAAPSRAIGMALHELITNAIKYGALSVPDGAVDIAWRLVGGTMFEISWRESGGPTVHKPTRTGFGRRVIEHMVAASTSGAVSIDYLPEGLRWSLAAPMVAIEAPSNLSQP